MKRRTFMQILGLTAAAPTAILANSKIDKPELYRFGESTTEIGTLDFKAINEAAELLNDSPVPEAGRIIYDLRTDRMYNGSEWVDYV